MNQQEQNTSSLAELPVQPEAKKCNHMIVIVILAILAVGGFTFGGFELYENLQNKSQPNNTEIEGPDSGGEEIVKEDKDETNSIISGSASFNIPNPAFNDSSYDGTVKFEYGISDNIMFAYSISYTPSMTGGGTSEVISNNVDIDTGEKLSNAEVLKRLDITTEEVYEKILENLADSVSIDSFLLSVNGSIDAGTITVSSFKNNIDEYVETLKGDQELFYVFLKDSKVNVSYNQSDVLKALGMSSHMGNGLIHEYVEVEL